MREEVGVVDVDLVGVDADDGPVLLVQVGHLEDVLPAQHDVVVELVPPGQRRQPRTWDVRDRAEIEPPEGPVERVGRQETHHRSDLGAGGRREELSEGHPDKGGGGCPGE